MKKVYSSKDTKQKNLFTLLIFCASLLFLSLNSYSQSGDNILNGTITDKDSGLPLKGTIVKIQSTSLFSISDKEGKYELSLGIGSYTLEVSNYGYKTLTQAIVISGAKKTVNFELQKNISKINSTISTKDDLIYVDEDSSEEVIMADMAPALESVSVVGYVSSKARLKPRSEKRTAPAPIYDRVSSKTDPVIESTNTVSAKLLTAGEINDFTKWNLWTDIDTSVLSQWQNLWKIKPQERYTVQLTNFQNGPVIDAHVFLLRDDQQIEWVAKTDNTGKAELWASIFDSTSVKSNYSITIKYQNKTYQIAKAKPFHIGINHLVINEICHEPIVIDAAFVVDATGSMGDEIEYLKMELNDVITQVKEKHTELTFNLGSVFYRDYGDAYVTKKSDFSDTTQTTIDFIKAQSAGGGGDFPEAVDDALDVAINQLDWSENARARILFLVLDAPPHSDAENIKRLQNMTAKAAVMGIRIVPITASGIDKSTEYLMRAMALATNGTYVFLTDDSGIGNAHIKPTTDEYKVELLNDVIVRLFDEYSFTPGCDNSNLTTIEEITDTMTISNQKGLKNNQLVKDTTNVEENTTLDTLNTDIPAEEIITWKYYPNPSHGIINIDANGNVGELFLADISGKILQKHICHEGIMQINLGIYPSGTYFLKYYVKEKDKWLSGKVVLIK